MTVEGGGPSATLMLGENEGTGVLVSVVQEAHVICDIWHGHAWYVHLSFKRRGRHEALQPSLEELIDQQGLNRGFPRTGRRNVNK